MSTEMKLGRNAPCWCGSGKKYKKCHLHRHFDERPTIEEGLSLQKKVFNSRYCLHPMASQSTCSGNIIRAHTLQKRGSLETIARNQHVYQLTTRLTEGDFISSIEAKLVGLNEASTFTGFCNKHDNDTFRPIEDRLFKGNMEQIFLLAYRALCRELFMKRIQQELAEKLRDYDRGLPLLDQIDFQQYSDAYRLGIGLGVASMERQKAMFDRALSSNNFDDMGFFFLQIDRTPEFVCTGGIILETDFDGNYFDQLGRSDVNQDFIYFTVIPVHELGGIVIFSTLDKSRDVKRFFRSLINYNPDRLPNAIARYAFEYHENTFINPDWWDSLKDDLRDSIIERYSHGISPTHIRTGACLLDDGIDIVQWHVEKVHFEC